MNRTAIFISHIAEEAPLAAILKRSIAKHFLGAVDVFVSSDTESIAAGDNWLKSIEQALERASIMLALCSPASVRRPWINFEAGAAWMKPIPIIPMCHSGLQPKDLPMPFAVLQAVTAGSANGLRYVYLRVGQTAGLLLPDIDPKSILNEITAFETTYQPSIPPSLRSEAERVRAALERMKAVLEEPEYRYRSIKLLAKRAAISESEAEDILRADPEIVFSKSNPGPDAPGETIARLKSR